MADAAASVQSGNVQSRNFNRSAAFELLTGFFCKPKIDAQHRFFLAIDRR